MRLAGVTQDEKNARRFGDYLLSIGIENSVEEGRQGWGVWVHEEGEVDRAQKEFAGFQWNVHDEKYRLAEEKAALARSEEEKEKARRERNIIKPQNDWHAKTRSGSWGISGSIHLGLLTLGLIAVCIAVAVATKLGQDRVGIWMQALTIAPVTIEGHASSDGLDAVVRGEAWRLVTPIFIHFGFMHIFFNLWWLKDLGSLIESRKGTLTLAGLVLVSGVVGNVAQYWWSGPLFGGMSGVVYALFGYVWLKGKLQPSEGMAVSEMTVIIMIGWLFLCMMPWMDLIANAAHVGGLLTGMAWAFGAYGLRRWRSAGAR